MRGVFDGKKYRINVTSHSQIQVLFITFAKLESAQGKTDPFEKCISISR